MYEVSTPGMASACLIGINFMQVDHGKCLPVYHIYRKTISSRGGGAVLAGLDRAAVHLAFPIITN